MSLLSFYLYTFDGDNFVPKLEFGYGQGGLSTGLITGSKQMCVWLVALWDYRLIITYWPIGKRNYEWVSMTIF